MSQIRSRQGFHKPDCQEDPCARCERHKSKPKRWVQGLTPDVTYRTLEDTRPSLENEKILIFKNGKVGRGKEKDSLVLFSRVKESDLGTTRVESKDKVLIDSFSGDFIKQPKFSEPDKAKYFHRKYSGLKLCNHYQNLIDDKTSYEPMTRNQQMYQPKNKARGRASNAKLQMPQNRTCFVKKISLDSPVTVRNRQNSSDDTLRKKKLEGYIDYPNKYTPSAGKGSPAKKPDNNPQNFY